MQYFNEIELRAYPKINEYIRTYPKTHSSIKSHVIPSEHGRSETLYVSLDRVSGTGIQT
jgi:hypothetical protein